MPDGQRTPEVLGRAKKSPLDRWAFSRPLAELYKSIELASGPSVSVNPSTLRKLQVQQHANSKHMLSLYYKRRPRVPAFSSCSDPIFFVKQLIFASCLMAGLAVTGAADFSGEDYLHLQGLNNHPGGSKLISQTVHFNGIPTKVIKITKTVAVKVPVPYPVKVSETLFKLCIFHDILFQGEKCSSLYEQFN